tara:strand:+ start:448 stop:639 length:192 start_codon:yes stop_codon:yes gene_type:complete
MAHGKKRRQEVSKKDERPKRKQTEEKGRQTIKARLRNLDNDNWEMVSEKFMKGNKHESRNDGE